MGKLILKICLFAIPVLLICLSAEYLLRSIPNDYKIKAKKYSQHAGNFEVLCLGESHAFSGINPKYLNLESFNGSHFAQTLNYDLEILNKYESKTKKLKFLLLPISYASFTSRLENQWEVKNYFLYYGIQKFHNIRYYTETLSLPLETNFNRIFSYYFRHESPVTTDNLGYSSIYLSNPEVDLPKTGKKSATVQTAVNYNNWNKNIESLQKIIEFCDKNNIFLILFTPPGHKHYRKNLDAVQLERTIAAAEKFQKKNNAVYYINMLKDSSFTDDDFFDADHFNARGAIKLTKKINTIIDSIGTEIQIKKADS